MKHQTRREEEPELDSDNSITNKKGRKKLVYGVVQNKWYGGKMDSSSLDMLKRAGEIEDCMEREKIFSQCRLALMALIRFTTEISFLSKISI